MAKTKLLEALEESTEADLAEIRTKITILQDQLVSLRSCEKILLAKFPSPESTAGQAAPIDKDAVLTQVHDLISKRGPMTAKQIGEAIGISYSAVGRLLRKSDWFRSDGRLFRIVIAGE